MATDKEILDARVVLLSKWVYEGACSSCGWHSALWEHGVDDSDIADALDNCNGKITLSCKSKDDDNSYSHRGVRIIIRDKSTGGL